MKKLTLTLLIYLIFLSSNVVLSETMYDLVKRKGIYYKKFSDISFTGKITGNPQGEFKNGKREDAWSFFNKNGQLNTKGNYKNGKEEGSWVSYHDNGKLYSKGNYKNGKKEGSWVRYWDNVQLMAKGDYKNGKKEGSWVNYNQDGTVNKNYAGTFKNGKRIND